jgi:hypothetical protein
MMMYKYCVLNKTAVKKDLNKPVKSNSSEAIARSNPEGILKHFPA